MTGQLDFNEDENDSENTSATDRNIKTTENEKEADILQETDGDGQTFKNQQAFIDEDEDVKFDRHMKWYIAYKQDESALMRRRQERAESQLNIEKEFHKNTSVKLKESQLKVERLEDENASLKSQLAVVEQNNDSCLQCDKKFKIKYRKLKFCGSACLQKMAAELKSAGLN